MIIKKKHCVTFFKPIIEESCYSVKDDHISSVIYFFKLKIYYEEAFFFTRKEAIFIFNYSGKHRIYDHIFIKHKELEENFDFILVEGQDCSNETQCFDIKINTEVAKTLQIPIILVINGTNKNIKTIYSHIHNQHVNFIMLIINKTLIPFQLIQSYLNHYYPTGIVAFTIPPDDILDKPTLLEIKKEFNAELIIGSKYDLNKITMKYIVNSIECHNSHLNEDYLIIAQGDRIDLILETLIANISSTYGNLSAIMLTGGILPENTFLRLMKGIPNFIPILSVYCDSLEFTQRVDSIKPNIYPHNMIKFQQSINIFENYVDNKLLFEKITFLKYNYITPQMFYYNILKKSKIAQKHIVLPEGIEERILIAASLFTKEGLGKITILGDPKKIMDKVNNLRIYWEQERITLLNPVSSPLYEDFYSTLYHLRKKKGLQLTEAKNLMLDASYFGTMMVYKGLVDGMVSGAKNTTANTIRPALQFIKTSPNINTVSSIFFMLLSDRVLVYGDCAIVQNPTAEQLADITIVSANTAEYFGFFPKIALLSYSSGYSGSGKDVEKVRIATEIVKNRAPHLFVEGPIQYDAAVDPLIGKKKMPNSPVAGYANVFIFPDLNTGNNTYKAVQRETKSLAIGPIIQGLNKPINDLSRGASVEDIYHTLLITSIQSIHN
jgi:phosphate acetyltransferase